MNTRRFARHCFASMRFSGSGLVRVFRIIPIFFVLRLTECVMDVLNP